MRNVCPNRFLNCLKKHQSFKILYFGLFGQGRYQRKNCEIQREIRQIYRLKISTLLSMHFEIFFVADNANLRVVVIAKYRIPRLAYRDKILDL